MKRRRRKRTREQILAGREIGEIEMFDTPTGRVALNVKKSFCNRRFYKNKMYNGIYAKEIEAEMLKREK